MIFFVKQNNIIQCEILYISLKTVNANLYHICYCQNNNYFFFLYLLPAACPITSTKGEHLQFAFSYDNISTTDSKSIRNRKKCKIYNMNMSELWRLCDVQY